MSIDLPYFNSRSNVFIQFSGRFVILSVSTDLKVIYDGNSYVAVALKNRFSEKIEGLPLFAK